MIKIFALARITIVKLLRSLHFYVVACVLIFGVVLLTLNTSGDGSAAGLFRVSVSYVIYYIGIFLSIYAIWYGCISVADEIERSQIHMIISKPVPRLYFWIGKWIGIIVVLLVLLISASLISYHLILWRTMNSGFNEQEIDRVKRKLLVGRSVYGANPTNRSRSSKSGEVNKNLLPEESMLVDIRPNSAHEWRFDGLPTAEDTKVINLRYRFWINSPKKRDQRVTEGIWWILNPSDQKFYPLPYETMSGKVEELSLSAKAIDKNGRLTAKYENRDREGAVLLVQATDGPDILIETSRFSANYVRVITILFFQIIFVTTLSCTAGAIFSIPMSIFISSSYIILGLLVVSLRFSFPELQQLETESIVSKFMALIRSFAGHITFPLSRYYLIDFITNGELIRFSQIIQGFVDLVLVRSVPVGFLGIWQLNRRELGTVTEQ